MSGKGSGKDIDVLVLGGAGVDTIIPVPALPLPYADSHMVDGIHARAGQTGDFVALGLTALGMAVHHLDFLGDDPEGGLVRDFHREHGIALTALPQAAGTKRATNLVSPDGRRLSLYDTSRTRFDDRFPEDTLRELAARSRQVHVSLTQPCADALPALRETGAPLSTDLHDWDGDNPYHEPFALAADLVFLSAAALTDVEATMRRIARDGRARTVVVTAGDKGAYLLTDGALTHVPASVPPASVVDSNGAGDAFAAGFLYGTLTGATPRESAQYGARAGAYACTVPATRAAALTRAEL
ncbi:adenosine kinase [Streptomyces niveiscabiei]|uniref:adenosine kinase n=1 Tax=Streptomyces niveiscabiei TaxID=164115 RepID=UPI0029B04B3C|nr:adenosine kinase [Streptomyces niveiscabiei]MDX3381062.1 adenosine kinase [Streptomyces niveiscabiei]